MPAVGLVLCSDSPADAQLGCAGGRQAVADARPGSRRRGQSHFRQPRLRRGAAKIGTVPAKTGTVPREPAAPRVEESQPSIYYLPDKQGNLQPVLDFKYEEFIDLYRLKNQLGRRDQPPRYSLQRMSATGTATETYAELTVQLQAVVRDNDWVRVPLRFDQGLLRGTVRYKGTGKQIVQYEGEGVGYVCWIRGKPDSQHEITLTMLVPLDSTGDETRLRLYVPRATASEMKLTAPVRDAVGSVSEGGMLLSAAAKGGTTEFALVGLGGDLQLGWHRPTPAAPQTPVALEATGTVLATLDGRWITTEATLSVRSLGAAFDRLTVRLPPGAELLPGKTDGYTVRADQLSNLRSTGIPPVAEKHGQDARATRKPGKGDSPMFAKTRIGTVPIGPRSVEVRLPKKMVGPVEIRLKCRRGYDPAKNPAWCELAGFEVVGAVRQWGTLSVVAGSQWQVLWGKSRETDRVAVSPDAAHKDETIAAFEYSCQPYSLSVKLAPRKSRINIEPEYVLLVDCGQVRLEGTLTYTIRGAKVSTLEIAIPGWELDEVGPGNLVNADDVTVKSGVVSIPLSRPSSGMVELQLRAHRSVEGKATALAVSLPRLRGGTVAPLALAVVAADNVELTPNAQGMAGLVRERIGAPMKLPRRQQAPLYYRGTGGDAVFAAGFRVLPQRISVEAAGEHTATGEESKTIVVDRAWVQSRLTSITRQDRAVFQLTTDRNEIEVVLPADAAQKAVALVDGRQVEPGRSAITGFASRWGPANQRLSECRLSLRQNATFAERKATLVSSPILGGQPGWRRVVVELRYHFAGPRPPRGAICMEFPRLSPGAWMRRMYWQLILPSNEHLIANPDGFTGEFVVAVVRLVLVLGPASVARSGAVGVVGGGGAARCSARSGECLFV